MNIYNILSKLTLREKIGQMVMPYFGAGHSREDINTMIHAGIGGLMPGYLYSRKAGADEIRKDIRMFQTEARIPLFTFCDAEIGMGMFCNDGTCTEMPGLMAIGACSDREKAGKLAYEAGLVIGEEAYGMGMNLVGSAVVDVNTCPSNPITNTRAVSDDAELVSYITVPIIKGVQYQKHVISIAKHFPGSGAHSRDPHFGLEVMNVTYEQMENIHLATFQKAIEAGVMCIMTNHAIYPPFDSEYPATLSYAILTELLRRKMGFKGLIITDGMAMGAITARCGVEESVLLAVQAGNDILLAPAEQEKTINIIEKAVSSGRIPENRIDESVERILKEKEWLGLFDRKFQGEITTPLVKRYAVAEQIAKESITLIRDRDSLIPLNIKEGRFLVLEPIHPSHILDIGLHINTTNLYNEIKKRHDNTDLYVLPAVPTESDTNHVVEMAGNYDMLFVGTSFRSMAGQVGMLTRLQLELLEKVYEVNHKVLFIVSNPYVAAEIPFAGTILANYSTSRVAVEATFDVVFGMEKACGTLPVKLPDFIDSENIVLSAHGG